MKLEQLRGSQSRFSSRTKLVLGAAGLLLFIVGVRRTFGPEEGGPGVPGPLDDRAERGEGGGAGSAR